MSIRAGSTQTLEMNAQPDERGEAREIRQFFSICVTISRPEKQQDVGSISKES